jgi:RNA polymerase sigma factor (sigma-70 family)
MRTAKKAMALRSQAERNELVVQWLPLVHKIVRDMQADPWVASMDRDDAVQAGRLALIRAAELWDESRDIQFNTYAFRSIERRIRHESRNQCLVHVPQTYFEATEEDQAEQLSPDRVKAASVAKSRPASLSARFDDHTDNHLIEPAVKEVDDDTEEQLSDKAELRGLIRQLEVEHQEFIHLRWFEGLSLKQVGDRLGFSKERARQVCNIAMQALRNLAGVVIEKKCNVCKIDLAADWLPKHCLRCITKMRRRRKAKQQAAQGLLWEEVA